MVAATALVALSALGVSACASNGHEARLSRPQSIEPVTVVTDPGQIVLPLDEFALTLRQSNASDYAFDLLVRTCMEPFGVVWPALPPAPPESLADRPLNWNPRRYGLLDMGLAGSVGYGLPPRGEAKPGGAGLRTEDRELVDDLYTGEGRSAIAGKPIPAGGCAAVARHGLGDLNINQNSTVDFEAQSYAAAKSDDRVLAAMRSWSECMSASGFDYATPLQAAGDPRWGDTSHPVRRSIPVARADVACKRDTNLAGIWLATERAYQEQLLETHRDELVASQHRNAAALMRAQQVLADLAGQSRQ